MRLITRYEPDRIILFGSAAEGKDRKGNDIDLLVVKETHKRPMERRYEVEMGLSDREVPIDLFVYTPQEMRELYAQGNPFIEEVVEKGRVLYVRKATSTWIKDAEEELESAMLLFEHRKCKPACYHSKQAVEKGLKALIIEQGKKPERTHDIVELYNTASRIVVDLGLSTEDAVYLNSIYKGRYPTEEGLLPRGEPSETDTKRAVQAARQFLEKLHQHFPDAANP